MTVNTHIQEDLVNEAFSKQSVIFDELEEHNPIIHWMRERIYKHVLSFIKPNSTILELNAGTGIDAIYFAKNGFQIHATDNADGMLKTMQVKIEQQGLQEQISISKCSFNELSKLNGNTYDDVFSNFGGLNCVEDLSAVIKSLDPLLKPGGIASLVIMPKVCPWELRSALRGNFKFAFRRFKKGGALAHIEGVYFTTYYYSPKYVQKAFGKNYKTLSIEGLASVSPPPCFEQFPNRFPRLYKWLVKIEEKLANVKPFSHWADHYIISVQKINNKSSTSSD